MQLLGVMQIITLIAIVDSLPEQKSQAPLERTLFLVQNLVLALIQNFNGKVSIK
jgi:hypothetical protein